MDTGRHRTIESSQNELYKALKGVLETKGLRRRRVALFSGAKIVRDALARHPDRAVAWVTPPGTDVPPDLPEHLDVYTVAGPLFRELDVLGTHHPLLLVGVPPLARWEPTAGLELGLTLFLPFQDPENVGTVIRSAVGFGVDRIVVLEEAAHPFLPKTVRASAGAVLDATLLRGPSISDLPAFPGLVALATDGEPLERFAFPPACGLLPGVEGPGIPQEWSGPKVGIALRPEVESINAATATAIVLYAWAGGR